MPESGPSATPQQPPERVLVDTAAAAAAAGVTTAVIRKWRQRGRITQHGRDARGRGLYDLAEVYQAAAGRRQPDRSASAADVRPDSL